MKKSVFTLLLGTLICASAKAALLGVAPGYPQITFVSTDPVATAYEPTNLTFQAFSVNALPFNVVFSSLETVALDAGVFNLQIQVDTSGNLLSGTDGFTLNGQVSRVVDGVTNIYTGTLLEGNVTAFGFAGAGLSSVAQYDFRVQLTGGQLKPVFDCANSLAITMSSEASSFTGGFTNAFSGAANGYCGPEDTIPPVVICPPLSAVVTTPATDPNDPTVQGFIITYPNPTVTDNCDPGPIIFCDTPSGSFVALNPGDLLTVTCYGIDVSGNFDACSFTVVMQQSGGGGSCPFAFTDNGCTPTVLPADPGVCSATYSFSPPVATNCSGQIFVATATALNEAGGSIQLTSLTNGMLQGQFPRTLTTNGDIITFTAVDGQSNTVVRQCQVFVKDTQPPTIMCLDQTATFKPILTNAISCIESDFNNNCIAASNTLWFSSVIKATSCQNPRGTFTMHITDQTIQLAMDNTNITLSVPDAYVFFSNGVAMATTIFTNNQWLTCSSLNCSGNTFASGLAWQVPFNLNNLRGGCWGRDGDSGPFRRRVNSATWCARFAVDTTGVALRWQWGAVVETKFSTNYNALCVKPVDDSRNNCWNNHDPAGSCENYKSYLTRGGRGDDGDDEHHQQDDDHTSNCTGILSDVKPCNLGKGTVCEGVVNFTTPSAADNCGNSVAVTCNPPSGSVFGPGNQLITCTAVDSSGNSNQCSFTLTVLAPIQVVFDSPACDNFADNTAQPDVGYSDMNCPDAPSTPETVTCFNVGDKICHVVRLVDCNGTDVTAALASCVTVHIDVTERQGTYSNSALVNDVSQNYSGIGSSGSIMVPCNGSFQYNLNTVGYPAKTVNTSRFFRSCVWVDYNSSPGVPVGMEDVLLQSR